ncbi:hypothetical protein [Roseovarius indicus]|uniref:Uncharacterized protein n=1 Tax=Roseovarius indicus TaxID=540747 RepID=A0A0T5P742_9RHOB|nr:hypothetical protein [Roseovarius indicus]KRS16941.1 hypothetical protein XM52_15305 [Roseovarius indicus]QEW29596.1 hypothetical protein RIdsm_05442 [Roseovarius indicus]SFE46900.1 hypothetical protein SAMN04488031_110140 [Roseovarius indicus]
MLEEARVVLAEGRIANVVEAAQSGYDRDPKAESAAKLTIRGRRRAVWDWWWATTRPIQPAQSRRRACPTWCSDSVNKRLGPQDIARTFGIDVTGTRVEAFFGYWKRH